MKSKLATFLTTLAISLVGLSGAATQAAGSGSLALSPSAGTENIGSTFDLGVYENGNGSPVNVVTADLSYDQSQLQFVSAACGGAFSGTAQASGGNGSVQLSCFTPGGATAPTDNELVGTVSFKALTGSGITAVTFGSGSIMASNGSNVWNGSPNGGTYTLATPVPAPAPTPAPNPTPAPTQPQPVKTTPAPATTPAVQGATTTQPTASQPQAAPASSTPTQKVEVTPARKTSASNAPALLFGSLVALILAVSVISYVVDRRQAALATVAATTYVAKPVAKSKRVGAKAKSATKKTRKSKTTTPKKP